MLLPLLALLAAAAPADAGAAAADVVKQPDSITTAGLPPIPASLVEAVRPYTEYRGASFLSFHPERREMLIATRFADTVQVHRVASPRGARTQLTFFADRVGSALYPRAPAPGGSPFLVFSRDSGGNEFYQSYRLDTDTGRVTMLTDGKSRNSLGVFARGGRRLGYTSTRRNGADSDLYVVDVADPKTDRLLAEVKGGGWEVLDWSPDGRTLLVREEISVNESYLWAFDVETGQRRALTARPAGEKIAYGAAQFTPDGKS